MNYYPGQKKKKEPSPRFAARRTLFDFELDDARSTLGKVIRDCPRLLPCPDRAASSMISHDGTACDLGNGSFLSRVVENENVLGKTAQ